MEQTAAAGAGASAANAADVTDDDTSAAEMTGGESSAAEARRSTNDRKEKKEKKEKRSKKHRRRSKDHGGATDDDDDNGGDDDGDGKKKAKKRKKQKRSKKKKKKRRKHSSKDKEGKSGADTDSGIEDEPAGSDSALPPMYRGRPIDPQTGLPKGLQRIVVDPQAARPGHARSSARVAPMVAGGAAPDRTAADPYAAFSFLGDILSDRTPYTIAQELLVMRKRSGVDQLVRLMNTYIADVDVQLKGIEVLGHYCCIGNHQRRLERRGQHRVQVFDYSLDPTEHAVVLACGGISALSRALRRHKGHRLVALRGAWTLEHVLSTDACYAEWVAHHGMEVLETLSALYYRDHEVITAVRLCQKGVKHNRTYDCEDLLCAGCVLM